MSNKVLAYLLIAIVVVAAGLWQAGACGKKIIPKWKFPTQRIIRHQIMHKIMRRQAL